MSQILEKLVPKPINYCLNKKKGAETPLIYIKHIGGCVYFKAFQRFSFYYQYLLSYKVLANFLNY